MSMEMSRKQRGDGVKREPRKRRVAARSGPVRVRKLPKKPETSEATEAA
jgi:hypothetical protein